MVTARSFAGRDEKIVANRELLALGLANVGASLVRGFPVSSSGTRTAIAIAAGRKTDPGPAFDWGHLRQSLAQIQ